MASRRVGDLKKTICERVSLLGYECVGTEFQKSGGSARITVFIDSVGGIGHADCERVSRALSDFFDEAERGGEAFLDGKYFLEVSSPGIERPLYTEEHYARFAGKLAALDVKGLGKIKGRIVSCTEGIVVLGTGDGNIRHVRFSDIKKGSLAFDEETKGRASRPSQK
ncbi:MAG: ribosome maturation factor RimP [Synergistaceae bacterium]|jgi:ribosome maturation factor RimP|nr:ribosome maturation factor RimP [Synergistaceae bacterium]